MSRKHPRWQICCLAMRLQPRCNAWQPCNAHFPPAGPIRHLFLTKELSEEHNRVPRGYHKITHATPESSISMDYTGDYHGQVTRATQKGIHATKSQMERSRVCSAASLKKARRTAAIMRTLMEWH